MKPPKHPCFGCGGRIRTYDLQVMSLTSYRTAPPRVNRSARAAWRVVAEGLGPRAVTPGDRPMGCSLCMAEQDQANRAISTSQLHTLPCFHTWPINVVVFHGSQGRTGFEGGFPLRCFQQLSLPYLATRLCRWRDNRSTRGTSTPVLSYWGQLLAILQHPRQIGTELSHDVLNPTHVPL